MHVKLNDDNIIITSEYKLIKNKSTKTNKDGKKKVYINYNCSFPYYLISIWNIKDYIYFYEVFGKVYISDTEPSGGTYKRILLNNRKNQHQMNSAENNSKEWAKLITIPRTLFPYIDENTHIRYTLNCNDYDFVNKKRGLILVELF